MIDVLEQQISLFLKDRDYKLLINWLLRKHNNKKIEQTIEFPLKEIKSEEVFGFSSVKRYINTETSSGHTLWCCADYSQKWFKHFTILIQKDLLRSFNLDNWRKWDKS